MKSHYWAPKKISRASPASQPGSGHTNVENKNNKKTHLVRVLKCMTINAVVTGVQFTFQKPSDITAFKGTVLNSLKRLRPSEKFICELQPTKQTIKEAKKIKIKKQHLSVLTGKGNKQANPKGTLDLRCQRTCWVARLIPST
jgi:hypothetical protein